MKQIIAFLMENELYFEVQQSYSDISYLYIYLLKRNSTFKYQISTKLTKGTRRKITKSYISNIDWSWGGGSLKVTNLSEKDIIKYIDDIKSECFSKGDGDSIDEWYSNKDKKSISAKNINQINSTHRTIEIVDFEIEFDQNELLESFKEITPISESKANKIIDILKKIEVQSEIKDSLEVVAKILFDQLDVASLRKYNYLSTWYFQDKVIIYIVPPFEDDDTPTIIYDCADGRFFIDTINQWKKDWGYSDYKDPDM